MQATKLPAEFLRHLEVLERAYLAESDPIRASGFAGGAQRWRREREPLLDAVEADGDLLDVGCANGHLAECLVDWARERGRLLTPYGVDYGERLITLARKRLPHWASHFYVGNAWDWAPPQRYGYVYTLYDCVPRSHLARYLQRLSTEFVEPAGRLILGAYGSRSRGFAPPPTFAPLSSKRAYESPARAQEATPPEPPSPGPTYNSPRNLQTTNIRDDPHAIAICKESEVGNVLRRTVVAVPEAYTPP